MYLSEVFWFINLTIFMEMDTLAQIAVKILVSRGSARKITSPSFYL
jgi:hypothetical protein